VFIATLVLSLVLAAVFAAMGTFLAVKNPTSADVADHLGFSLRAFRVIGWLLIIGAAGLVVGLFYAPVGEAAALLLALIMLGAVISRVRVRDAFAKLMTPLALGALAVVTLLLRADTV
jgi:hypothetical protein